MLYTYMEKLPSNINNNIFRFLSHPVADAIRDRISEFQALNSQYESVSELHTFYIFFFCDKKIRRSIGIMEGMYKRWGVCVCVDDTWFRPDCGISTTTSSLGTSCPTFFSIIILCILQWFLSHPVADAIRDRITEIQAFSGHLFGQIK